VTAWTPKNRFERSEDAMHRKEILAKLAAGEITLEEADRLLAELGPELPPLTCKVSPKGAVSVYGLQRMPVTLYADQWFRLLEFGDEIRAFIERHRAELRWREKGEMADKLASPDPDADTPAASSAASDPHETSDGA